MTDPKQQLARQICGSLESLMSSPLGFGLPLSPTQTAIARAIDGRSLGELAAHPDVVTAFGGAAAVEALPRTAPMEVVVLAAVRSAKSQFAAGTAICASQRADIGELKPGEIPRVAIVSLTLDNAQVTYAHVVGTLTASPVLSTLLEGTPRADSVMLRHPSGRLVEIKVVCLNAAGGSLVSRWLLGAIFDEAPRCPADGVKSLSDARTNVVGRLRPGCMIMTIGSPWSPVGPIPDLVREHFGRPSKRLVVVRATGTQMNPAWWTPERVAATKESDPTSYRTDVLAEFLDPEENLLSSVEVDAVSTVRAPVPFVPGQSYVAIIDPATRGNGWTLGLLTRTKAGLQLCLWRQWVGHKSAPLSPDRVFGEIAAVLRPYNVREVSSDQWAADALRDIAERHGLSLYDRAWTADRKLELFSSLRLAITERRIELPTDPVVRSDLLSVRKRVTQTGIAIDLPTTSDGRHCDYAAMLALGMGEYIAEPIEQEKTDDEPERPHRSNDWERLAMEYGY
jgi:hypothetical protein